MWLDPLFTPFLFSLLNTVNEMGGGGGVNFPLLWSEKACFTSREEEERMMVTLMGLRL